MSLDSGADLERPFAVAARALLSNSAMPNAPDEEERISRKVVVEHQTTSSQNTVAIIIIVVIALALVAWILMHLHH